MNKEHLQSLPRISSIDGLKAIGALLIFWWHSPLPNPSADLGARICEFFFVAAGFLYYYSHYTRPIPCTFFAMAEYVRKKLVYIYPIHLIGFIAEGLRLTLTQWLTTDTAIKAVLHLSLLHSWSPSQNVYWAFNGVSWFVSSLIFCYFVGAIVMRLMSTPKKAIMFFITFMCLRLVLDYIQINCPGQYFTIDLHVSPIVRSLEFFCGMAVASFTISIRKNCRSMSRPLFTLLELSSIFLTIYLVVTHQQIRNRAEFVILFSLVIFVFSFDQGWISTLLSAKPFRWFASIQLEFYMFHTFLIKYIQPKITWSYWDWYTEATLICFIATLAFVYLYRLLLKKPLSRLFDNASQSLFKLLR